MSKINPRRPLDDDNPNGYLESDRDYVLNNLEACVKFLDDCVKADTPQLREFVRTWRKLQAEGIV